jgi:1-acyl-sn-glycerol-3-phosphate acyltransferase
MTDLYNDIRPYRDHEVSAVVELLLSDNEFIDTLIALRGNRIAKWFPSLVRLVARRTLKSQLSGVNTIDGFQALVKPRLDRVVEATSRFSYSGINELDSATSYLLISNHRDIVMDSAYANSVLVVEGHRTAQVAIGDNLLQKPWVSHLMRINKSFIVKRSLSGPKQQLAVSKQLANFMRQAIVENQGPLWIAQREGRAKDGDDRTEAAILKMLSLSRDKSVELPDEVLGKLNIVPLTISYEIDPCDVLKARELAYGAGYEKAPFEDLKSIAQGIEGQKGYVHIHFGTPLNQPSLSVPEAVSRIDDAMVANYRLFKTNFWACAALGHSIDVADRDAALSSISQSAFFARFDELEDVERHQALEMYARPVLNWMARKDRV